MFKLMFILFVIKQLLGNATSGINIYSAKQSIIRWGNLSGDKSDRNIAYLKHTNFRVYLFLRAKKNCISQVLIFSEWQFRVYKFQPYTKKNKKKTVESRYMQLIFLLRSME